MSKAEHTNSLAQLERQLRTRRALGCLSESHLHRAIREDALGFTIGRDAILADWVIETSEAVIITADFDEMIAFEVGSDLQKWHGHRWVTYENAKIARETLIENRDASKVAGQMHPPLGELRPGRGQYDAGLLPSLPSDFPDAAKSLAALLHQAWNGRAFNLYDAPWLMTLVRALPDATFYFERALVRGDEIAILWRLHGHHAHGQRVRLIGSSVMTFIDGTITSDMTVVDFAAFEAQLDRALIDYT